jgi:excisionase family DNA binding protein
MTTPGIAQSLLTVQQIADELNVQQQAVLRWIHSGQLEAINCATNPTGRALWRIEPAAYRRFLDQRKNAAPGSDNSLGSSGESSRASGRRRTGAASKPTRQFV